MKLNPLKNVPLMPFRSLLFFVDFSSLEWEDKTSCTHDLSCSSHAYYLIITIWFWTQKNPCLSTSTLGHYWKPFLIAGQISNLVLPLQDLNSGLIGPLIVCRKDVNASLVHRVLLFMIFNENESWYLDENINTYAIDPSQVDKNNNDFKLSNKMHGKVPNQLSNKEFPGHTSQTQVSWDTVLA